MLPSSKLHTFIDNWTFQTKWLTVKNRFCPVAKQLCLGLIQSSGHDFCKPTRDHARHRSRALNKATAWVAACLWVSRSLATLHTITAMICANTWGGYWTRKGGSRPFKSMSDSQSPSSSSSDSSGKSAKVWPYSWTCAWPVVFQGLSIAAGMVRLVRMPWPVSLTSWVRRHRHRRSSHSGSRRPLNRYFLDNSFGEKRNTKGLPTPTRAKNGLKRTSIRGPEENSFSQCSNMFFFKMLTKSWINWSTHIIRLKRKSAQAIINYINLHWRNRRNLPRNANFHLSLKMKGKMV